MPHSAEPIRVLIIDDDPLIHQSMRLVIPDTWKIHSGYSLQDIGDRNYDAAFVDMHLKGKEGQHQQMTGKLVHLGMLKKEIKIQTAEGEKVFPLTEQGQKTKGIPDGTLVTIELNEVGAVIDVHRANMGGEKH